MYRSVQFSIDGNAWIFDHENKSTIDEVWEAVSDQGSKWIFYPIPFVIRGERNNTDFKYQRIVSAPSGLRQLERKTIRTTMDFIRHNPDYIQMILR